MSMITGGHGIGRLAAGHALPLHLLFLLLSYRVLYSCAGKHGRLCALCCCAEVAAARQRPEEGSREDSPFYDTLLLAMRHDGWDMSGSTGISGDAPAHQHTSLLYAIPIFSLLLVYLFRFPLFCLPSRRPCCRNLLLFEIIIFVLYKEHGRQCDTMTDRHTNLDLLEPRKVRIEEKMICKLFRLHRSKPIHQCLILDV